MSSHRRRHDFCASGTRDENQTSAERARAEQSQREVFRRGDAATSMLRAGQLYRQVVSGRRRFELR